MYSTAKRLSLIGAILTVLNIVATILFFLYFPNSGLSFPLIFTAGTYLVTASVTSLLLTICVRSLCVDLEYEFEDNARKFRDLSKKIHDLEARP